ncbi:hypothetical protein K7432_001017 [Basidiobolus ranarum]|uniref:Uncharacterized protein n=1 Tax=Basidiobolus ranarum TaxID=34480 RepID=A0ABR2WAA1_9FUNG
MFNQFPLFVVLALLFQGSLSQEVRNIYEPHAVVIDPNGPVLHRYPAILGVCQKVSLTVAYALRISPQIGFTLYPDEDCSSTVGTIRVDNFRTSEYVYPELPARSILFFGEDGYDAY